MDIWRTCDGTAVANGHGVGAHDKAFRRLMKEKGVAETLLRERLPRGLVRRFAGPPQLSSESFVDEALRGSLADVVLRVPLKGGEEAHVYCLVEHKRTTNAYVLVQVLRYLTALYAQLAKAGGGGRLPAVVPLIIYNGFARWSGPLRFSELIDVPASLRRLVVDFEVILVDVGAEAVDTLSEHPTLRGGLLGLKAAATPTAAFPSVLRGLVHALRDDESTRRLFLEYLLKVAGPEVLPAVERARREVDEENDMQTAAQFLDHRGYNRGMRHGLKKGLKKGLEKGLEKGRSEATELMQRALQQALRNRFRRIPKDVQTRIAAADLEQLTTWFGALGEVKTLKALFSA